MCALTLLAPHTALMDPPPRPPQPLRQVTPNPELRGVVARGGDTLPTRIMQVGVHTLRGARTHNSTHACANASGGPQPPSAGLGVWDWAH